MVLSALLAVWFTMSLGVAGPDDTAEALDRLEEVLELRLEDGELAAKDLLPALIVSARPWYAENEGWYTTRVIEVLQGRLGASGLRLCEACMVPRMNAEQGALVYQTGPLGLDEVVRLDQTARGSAEAARTAIWLDEHRGGVSIRIVDLATGGVVFAQNIDPSFVEYANTQRMYSLAAEQERRARDEPLTQAFVDLSLYPQAHVSLDWTDQWGRTNANLTGMTLSVVEPIVGIGACHYRRADLYDVLIGGKFLVSAPRAILNAIDQESSDIPDPLITAVGVVRVPFGRSNYGLVATASTSGQIGVGISLMNINLLPVIP